MRTSPYPWRARRATGSALVFVLALVLVLAVAGVALIKLAGGDRADANKLGREDRGLACAEAGIQYARRFFGACYASSSNWNGYLSKATGFSGFRYDPAAPLSDTYPTSWSSLPMQVLGASNGSTLDPGSDLGTGQPVFWVSIRDDVDELPAGISPDDRTHDNNGAVIIRSECINPAWARLQGGTTVNVVLEATLTYGNQTMIATTGSGGAVCSVGGSAAGTAANVSSNAGSRGNNL